jgi:hypothetical protein
MSATVIATIERGTTEWLARILEPGKPPAYFVPSGRYFGVGMSTRTFLLRAVQDTYPDVRFVTGEVFNQCVVEEELIQRLAQMGAEDAEKWHSEYAPAPKPPLGRIKKL